MQIKPLVEPTKRIMKIGVKKYDWHELFPKGIHDFFLGVRVQIELLLFSWYPLGNVFHFEVDFGPLKRAFSIMDYLWYFVFDSRLIISLLFDISFNFK